MLGREVEAKNSSEALDPSGMMQLALTCWKLDEASLADVDLTIPPQDHLYLWIMRLPSSVNPADAARTLLDRTEAPKDSATQPAQFAAELRALLRELCLADQVAPTQALRRRGGRQARHGIQKHETN